MTDRDEGRAVGEFAADWMEIDPLVAAIEALVMDAVVFDAVAELDRAHVVLILDGRETYVMGPYPDGLSAAAGAENDKAMARREFGAAHTRRYQVLPLCSPTEA